MKETVLILQDFPRASLLERNALSEEIYREVLGPRDSNALDRTTWSLLNGLASHDLSAMRELIGMPQKVISAARSLDGQWLWVTFQ